MGDNKKANPPSCAEIAKSLEAFQAHRYARAEATFKISFKVTRLEALASKFAKLMALYVIPHSGEFLANNFANGMIGAEKLDFLPDPERSLSGTMAFNQNYGIGKAESLLRRARRAVPLLILGYFCYSLLAGMQHTNGPARVISGLDNGGMTFGSNQTADQTPSYHDGVTWLEHTFRPLATVFAPSITDSDQAYHLQMLSFLAALCPLYLIWLLESHRRANTTSFARFPLIFALASLHYGIECTIPIYFFLHYIQSPLSHFAAFDQRLINVAAARTALPAFALACILLMLTTYIAPHLSEFLDINTLWQNFPISLSLTHYILKTFCVKDTTKEDRIHNTRADLPSIRFAIRTFAIVSTLAFNWIRWQLLPPSTSLSRVFTNPLSLVLNNQPNQLSLVLVVLAAFFWLALLFRDLKEVEMICTSWVKLVSCAVLGSLICGPGSTVTMAWLWREEVLASKRAKGAVVRRDYVK